MMKNILPKALSLLFLSFYLNSFCQFDEKEESSFVRFRPYMENGFSFIRSPYLKAAYSNTTIYHWGGGFRIGNSLKSDILPYLQINSASYNNQSIDSLGVVSENKLYCLQFALGLWFQLHESEKGSFHVKSAFLTTSVIDEMLIQSGNARGLQLALGYEWIIFKNSRVYLNLGYDLLKMKKAEFRDYDSFRVTMGFMV